MHLWLKLIFNICVAHLVSSGLIHAQDYQNISTSQISKIETVPEIPDIELGSPDAKVKLIEYSALNCVHCARFHTEFFPHLYAKYIATGKVRYIYRYFSIDMGSAHAMAVITALPQNEWFDAITKAYAKQKEWIGKDHTKLSKVCGISEEDCNKNVQDQKILDSILAKRFNAERRLTAIDSTPTFQIISPKGDILINTSITNEELEKKIASLL